jgi:mono/diheme cytochrome c family protein
VANLGKLRIFLALFACLAAFGFIGSCGFYNEKNPPDPATISPQNVSWQRVSNEFFQPRCAVCHGQGGAGIDINDYSGVLAKLSRIQQEISRKNMPPDSPLTVYEQTLFTTWVQNGTPYAATGAGQ